MMLFFSLVELSYILANHDNYHLYLQRLFVSLLWGYTFHLTYLYH